VSDSISQYNRIKTNDIYYFSGLIFLSSHFFEISSHY